jgi:BlaI family penicillinase repressor
MPFTPRDITDTELDLLRILWRRGPSTVRQLAGDLYGDPTHPQIATVQSLLNRLEAKDCVHRERGGRVNRFSAMISRSDLIARRLREVSDSLCDGSMAPLVMHLADRADLGHEEIEALRNLIQRLDDEVDRGSTD